MRLNKGMRRQEILQALARMLESQKGRITTAALSSELKISEAALYRHFSSKVKMYEGLLDFAEETIFARISSITAENQNAFEQCNRIISLILNFCVKNPGITRLLNGDALAYEDSVLFARIKTFYDRLELQFQSTLLEGQSRFEFELLDTIESIANLMITIVEGKISAYVRSDFNKNPLQSHSNQGKVIVSGISQK